VGITESSVREDATALAISVGLFERAVAMSQPTEAGPDPHLVAMIADSAVLHPDQAAASLPDVRRRALEVRTALERLEAGDAEGAQAALKDTPRNSPFADWRLFVRGLAAYYRQDFAEMRSSWDRLEPGRAASRIAQPLRVLAGAVESGKLVPEDNGTVRLLVARIDSALFGQPVLPRLCELRTRAAEEDSDGVVRALRRLCEPFRGGQPEFLDRLGRVLLPIVIHRGSTELMEGLTETLAGPPIDPNWNRAWALFFEHPEDGSWEEAEAYWKDYLKDLKRLPAFSPDERKLAQALVWRWIGTNWLLEANQALPRSQDSGVRKRHALNRAIKAFQRSLALAPDLREVYYDLASAQHECGQDALAEETYKQLLARFPEDLEALRAIVPLLLCRDEPLVALEYALRAHHLKPLDREIAERVAICRMGAARHHALAGRWEDGRACLAAVEALGDFPSLTVPLLARKAAFEFKAGELSQGHQWARQAIECGSEPVAVLLHLLIEAERYEVADHIILGFEREWKDRLKRKCGSAAAGGMARLLLSHLVLGTSLAGLRAYTKLVVTYLGRCRRVKWAENDLRDVCSFLQVLHEHEESGRAADLLGNFLKKGLQAFSESVFFWLHACEREVAKGPVACDRPYARYLARRTAELAERSPAPEDKPAAGRARHLLDLLGPGPESPWPGRSGRPKRSNGLPFGSMLDQFAKMIADWGLDMDEILEEAERFAADSAGAEPRPGGPKR
jgi:tetratricopeptide (TPR) repeat protein